MPATHPDEFRRRAVEFARLRTFLAIWAIGFFRKILRWTSAYFSRENTTPKTGFRLFQELAAQGFPVAVSCRILKVSTSGFSEWRQRPPSTRDRENAKLAYTIAAIHAGSRQTYGVQTSRKTARASCPAAGTEASRRQRTSSDG